MMLEVMPLDKRILNDYIDACAQVKETKEALLKLRKAKKRREQDAVKGSSHEFPYTAQTFHIEGIAYPLVQDPGEEDHLEEILRERLQNAERIKHDVEAWLNTIPMRMQRIIKYKIFEDLTWAEVAKRMGRKATELSVKKEYQRFMNAA
jgi:DNA-directed RNA polymerase specialized sigma24 family protein